MEKALKPLNFSNPQFFKAVKSVREAGSYFEEMSSKVEAHLLNLDARLAAVENIDQEYADKLAAAKRELEYQSTLDAEATFGQLAMKLGMGVITTLELNALRQQDRDLDAEIKAAVTKAIAATESRLTKDHNLDSAEKDAELKFMEKEIESLKASITFLKEQLSETRTSAERMFEHAGKSTIVTQSK